MKGFQLTFFTQQDVRHGSVPLGEWLLQEAKRQGIAGATLIAASEGFGHDRHIHAARFVELADQPVEVIMAVTEEDATRFLQSLSSQKINVFFTKTPIEFGMTGDV